MKTLMDPAKFREKSHDEPWKKSERDRCLDLWFSGTCSEKQIARKLQKGDHATHRKIQHFVNNEEGRAEKYEPFRRVSRAGKRLTENERKCIASHRERKLPVEVTARLLQRPLEDLQGKDPQGKQAASKDLARGLTVPTLDLIMALRYAYHVYVQEPRIMKNRDYDALVEEEIEYGGGAKAIEVMRATPVRDVPPRIKSLALYLQQRTKDERATTGA